jgi:hypothetical protein
VAGFAGFLLGRENPRMHVSDHMRRWRRAGLCGLLCVAAHGLAMAQAATPPPPPQPAPATAAPAAKAGQTTSAQATAKHTSAHTSAQKSKSSHGKKGSKKRGQQAIDSARAREIQTALIREHYMQGQPSGTWDSATQAAMQRYQADHGWQSKTTPDARALIKLGLGPSHDHLLNPESAMTTPTPMPTAPGANDPKTAAKPAPAADSVPKQ